MASRWLLGLLVGAVTGGLFLSVGSPARADVDVARFSVVQGPVTVNGPSGLQAAATNTALLPGDYISTGPAARAEIDLNGDSMLRLDGGVAAHFIDRNDVQLAQGTLEVSVLYGGYGSTQIDTPSVTVRATEKGAYRVSISASGTTYVTARRGRVQVVTPQQTYTVEAGTAVAAVGPATQPTVTSTTAVASDSFDDFTAARDQTLLAQSTTNSPDDASYPVWGSASYSYGYPWGVPIIAGGVCGYGPVVGFGYGGWSWGVSIGYVGGCYPGLAYAGYYPWYSPYWNGYGYGYGGYGWNPYPYSPPIVIVNQGGGGRTILRRVGRAGTPRTPLPPRTTTIGTVARQPIARQPIVASRPVLAPVERPRETARAPVEPVRTAAAPAREEKPSPAKAVADDPWRRYDEQRGVASARVEPARVGPAPADPTRTDPKVPGRDSDAWDHFAQTRGSISVKPAPIEEAPLTVTRGESTDIGSGTHTWNSVSTSSSSSHSVESATRSVESAPRESGSSGGGSRGGGGHPPSGRP
jgi:hypothetical protein